MTPSRSAGAYSDRGSMVASAVPHVLRSPSRASSRQSVAPDPARPPSRASSDRHRTLSMHAGSTPAFPSLPMARIPSASSLNSDVSRPRSPYEHYNPGSYVDVAALASNEDLTALNSPHTRANTMANAHSSSSRPRSRGSFGSFGG